MNHYDATELETALRLLVGDRAATSTSRALAADLVYILEDLQAVRERGFGHVTITYRDGEIVDVDCSLKKRKLKQAG